MYIWRSPSKIYYITRMGLLFCILLAMMWRFGGVLLGSRPASLPLYTTQEMMARDREPVLMWGVKSFMLCTKQLNLRLFLFWARNYIGDAYNDWQRRNKLHDDLNLRFNVLLGQRRQRRTRHAKIELGSGAIGKREEIGRQELDLYDEIAVDSSSFRI